MCSKRCKHTFKDRIPTCGLERRSPPQTNGGCMLPRAEDFVDCDRCKPALPIIEHICLCKPESPLESQQTSQHEATTGEPLSSQQQLSAEFGPAQQLERSSNEGTVVKKSGNERGPAQQLERSKNGGTVAKRSSYERGPPKQLDRSDNGSAVTKKSGNESGPAEQLEHLNNEDTVVKKNGYESGISRDHSSYVKLPPTQIRHMDEWEAMAVMLATNGRVWGVEDKNFARQYKASLSAVNTKFEEEAAKKTIQKP